MDSLRMVSRMYALVLALLLAACSGADKADAQQAPDYRYRLTVEVNTPDGVRAGSSVIEVKQRPVRLGSDPSQTGVERRARGEAVAVDLPGGRTLFALLRSDNSVNWSAFIMQVLAPKKISQDYIESLSNMLSLTEETELPRFYDTAGEKSGYPMLVTFGDINDPTSMERVDPDDLAASFGEGVSLKGITVQITDDPVTTGIEERLGWLSVALDHDYSRDGPFYAEYPTEVIYLRKK